MTESPLNSALRQFEAAEANLLKAERVLSEIAEATPTGISFGSNRFYEDLSRDFEALVDALPLIDGWKPACRIMELDEIAQARLDAMEIDEFECTVALERQIDEPASDLRKYRHSFDRKRRQLIREALIEAIDSIDGLLRNLAVTFEGSTSQTESVDCPQFSDLRNAVAQIATLLGSSVAQPARWNDLERNLHFGLLGDLNNIITHEWPRVKSGLLESLYGEREPIPTEAQDLGDLVRQSPQGRVATKLAWDRLSPEDFERLIFVLIASESGYENPEWLMKTTAPDRGRDLGPGL